MATQRKTNKRKALKPIKFVGGANLMKELQRKLDFLASRGKRSITT